MLPYLYKVEGIQWWRGWGDGGPKFRIFFFFFKFRNLGIVSKTLIDPCLKINITVVEGLGYKTKRGQNKYEKEE